MPVRRFATARARIANPEEIPMPVFILWAIPAVVVLGGGAYWLMHIH